MNYAASQSATQTIVLDEVFPHAPEILWATLTSGALMARWLMPPSGFEAVVGQRFSFQTTPGGAWDGVIHCEVLEVSPNRRLAFAWRSGHASNVGYGALLDTVVSFDLSPAEGGTRLRLVHAGFVAPSNDATYRNLSEGWPKVFKQLDSVAAEQAPPTSLH
ncbi:SRPBCC domain-containing protein [Lysobacter sp. Root983]|uniref:SRPBCC family protein n=1 Tax=Lysobacter sp. Root983 TaxID=1736613 RepID=UPI0007104818|nr:SRPBCC domain-containing protein [Lysobacter sp. Root983]KRD77578.1 ATPase [Lysobacter sp. Root983]